MAELLKYKTICFAGKFKTRTHAEAKEVAVGFGATVTRYVTGNTNVLIVGPTGGGSKLEHARLKGIEIWTEGQFNSIVSEIIRGKKRIIESNISKDVDEHAFSPATKRAKITTDAAQADPNENIDIEWLHELKLKISVLSLEPLSGSEVISRIRIKTKHVITRYLPCVDFLVSCQQELRKGLAIATQKRLVRGSHSYRNVMTPHQFHSCYIEPLSEQFKRKNANIMEPLILWDAGEEIKKLSNEAERQEWKGCETVKNTFLGGMTDGQSWGLRKWLSKHGSALHICTDLECITNECQKLDRNLETTKKLAAMMRPLAQEALNRLNSDVPAAYQEVSTAHPYLPFFHRLEAALRNMANFDPEDDDVICLDDLNDADNKQLIDTTVDETDHSSVLIT